MLDRGVGAVEGGPTSRAGPLSSPPAIVEELRRLQRLMTECRFGFMAALAEWKENGPARQGLAACLAAMIEHELARKDREGAAALIAELPERRPDLEARLASLDAEIRGRRERDVRLRTL